MAAEEGHAGRVPVTDHELIRLIGRGSYGEVWLAKNALEKFRAIKIVHEKTFRDKRPFDREFNGVLKFEPVSRLHEGLMDVLHAGRNDAAGYFYCVMELADDVASGQEIDPEKYSPRTLAHDLAERRRLPLEECHRVGLAIASALEFLHARGLVHRDVKPGNVVFVNGIPNWRISGWSPSCRRPNRMSAPMDSFRLRDRAPFKPIFIPSAKCFTKSAPGRIGTIIPNRPRGWRMPRRKKG
jgi:serine/threonine protein kinase